MTVLINLQNQTLVLKILPGPFWSEDLSRIKQMSCKKYNSSNYTWEVPVECVKELKSRFEDFELIFKDEVKTQPENRKGILDYAPYLGEIESPLVLKPYQDRYVRLNKSLERVILAAATGAGKTLCSTIRYQLLSKDQPLLIVCPKILKINWQESLRIDFNLKSLIFWGTAKQKEKLNAQTLLYPIVITTYECLKDLKRFDFKHLIVDEAHLLSNPGTSRFKDFSDFYKKLEPGVKLQLLSGTPIQHKPKDIWSLVHFINPHQAGSYKAWCSNYEEVVKTFKKEIVLKDKNGRVLKDYDGNPKTFIKEVPLITRTRNLPELRSKLSTIMYRISREDALECKENQEIIYLDMTKAQQRLYNLIKDEILVDLENKTLSIQHAPVRMLRLLQACEGLFNFETSLESTKLEYINYQIENNPDEKLVVWSRFKPLTYVLKELYPDKAAIYNGDLSDMEKQLSIWAFNGVKDKEQAELYSKYQKKLNYPFDPGKAMVWSGVIDLKSSLGFDLHRFCNKQIFASYSFLGSANYQSASRILRLGQQEELVSTQYLVCKDTIEPSALQLILKNLQVSTGILDGDSSLSFKTGQSLISLLKKEF